ncbi:hypothetical protein [Desulfovibrio inopinatus]|uniref:hypothetical protein n=1 Tax=Desulfovibrio inopinatus TaxID=102109 RepID=UPI0004220637|nr:hypothetical protein [Desulfovibrio inopinatus]
MRIYLNCIVVLCSLAVFSLFWGCARPTPPFEAAPYTRQTYDALEAELAASDIDPNEGETVQEQFNLYVEKYKEAYAELGYDFEKSIIKLRADSEADHFNQTSCYIPRCALTVRHLCLVLNSQHQTLDVSQPMSKEAAEAVYWFCGQKSPLSFPSTDTNESSNLP